jgi:hypothetical protein
MNTKTIKPFANDAEFLDQAIGVIHARCRRVVADRELRTARRGGHGDAREAQDGAVAARRRETESKAALDARLVVHRKEGEFALGFEKIAQEADLDEDEQTILLLTFICAASEDLSSEVFEGLEPSIYISISVEGICRVLEADSVGDRLRVRRKFSPKAPLIRNGLVKLTGRDENVPQDINGLDVKLAQRAFDIMVGNR